MKIVISPYSRKLRNRKNNPKNYPWWQEVIDYLVTFDNEIIQLGIDGEKVFDGVIPRFNLKLKEIEQLISNCNLWISVDNFLPHLASHTNKRGIVIWGMSNPKIFGYSQNINIIKDIKYLREKQFDIWESVEYNPDVFVKPEVVLDFIYKYK